MPLLTTTSYHLLPATYYLLPSDATFACKRQHLKDLKQQLGPWDIQSLDNLPSNAEEYTAELPGTNLNQDVKHYSSRIIGTARVFSLQYGAQAHYQSMRIPHRVTILTILHVPTTYLLYLLHLHRFTILTILYVPTTYLLYLLHLLYLLYSLYLL